ncbi:MAG TPA: hypothetical protein VFA18_09130, partial [Gemmataceae bacterium]|nr:hypothetical protein [Gemmataceae bacterium]
MFKPITTAMEDGIKRIKDLLPFHMAVFHFEMDFKTSWGAGVNDWIVFSGGAKISALLQYDPAKAEWHGDEHARGFIQVRLPAPWLPPIFKAGGVFSVGLSGRSTTDAAGNTSFYGDVTAGGKVGLRLGGNDPLDEGGGTKVSGGLMRPKISGYVEGGVQVAATWLFNGPIHFWPPDEVKAYVYIDYGVELGPVSLKQSMRWGGLLPF